MAPDVLAVGDRAARATPGQPLARRGHGQDGQQQDDQRRDRPDPDRSSSHG
jgi:hypothetical protein